MARQIMDKTIDLTKRLEWKVSKTKFETNNLLSSQTCIVNINNQGSEWRLGIVREVETWRLGIMRENHSIIFLKLNQGDFSTKVEIEGIGVETDNGYKPCEPLTDEYCRNSKISKILHFDGNSPACDRICETDAGTTEDFLKLFCKSNKMTVVATLRFYVDRNDFIKKNERERNFLTHLRSISELDTLADFTVVCGDREFKCHRVILASMSTVFKTMLLNDHFVENRESSVTIENSITIENSTPDIVEAMLEFMAKGVVPCDIEGKAIDLIDLANKYNLQDLIEICESSLVNNLTIENVIETLIAIDLHVSNSQQKLVDFIKTEAAEVVKTKDWKKFVMKFPDLVTEIFLSAVLPPGQVTNN